MNKTGEIFLIWNYGFNIDIKFFEKADISARNTFGLALGFVTAYGLMRYCREVKELRPS